MPCTMEAPVPIQACGALKALANWAESKPAITQTVAMSTSLATAAELIRKATRAGIGHWANDCRHQGRAARASMAASTRPSSVRGARWSGTERRVRWMVWASSSGEGFMALTS